jgi:hypothetical protein
MKVDKVRGRLQAVHALRALRNSGLIDQKAINVIVDGGILSIKKESGYAQLKRSLGPPPKPRGYDAHHWIPLEQENLALRRCVDPNDHGQWLTEAIHSKIHNVPEPGFVFKGKTFTSGTHNAFWDRFFHVHFPNATELDILDFALHLKNVVYKL